MVEQGNDARSTSRRPPQPVGEKLPERFACQACPTPADALARAARKRGRGWVLGYVPPTDHPRPLQSAGPRPSLFFWQRKTRPEKKDRVIVQPTRGEGIDCKYDRLTVDDGMVAFAHQHADEPRRVPLVIVVCVDTIHTHPRMHSEVYWVPSMYSTMQQIMVTGPGRAGNWRAKGHRDRQCSVAPDIGTVTSN